MQSAENDLEKARRLVEAAEERFKKATIWAFKKVAKIACKWRLTGVLSLAEVIDGNGNKRYLRRF